MKLVLTIFGQSVLSHWTSLVVGGHAQMCSLAPGQRGCSSVHTDSEKGLAFLKKKFALTKSGSSFPLVWAVGCRKDKVTLQYT